MVFLQVMGIIFTMAMLLAGLIYVTGIIMHKFIEPRFALMDRWGLATGRYGNILDKRMWRLFDEKQKYLARTIGEKTYEVGVSIRCDDDTSWDTTTHVVPQEVSLEEYAHNYIRNAVNPNFDATVEDITLKPIIHIIIHDKETKP